MLEKNIIIVTQGDSITEGNRGPSQTDYNHVLGHGYVQMAAGKLGAIFPDKGIFFYNRGVSGDTIDQMTARWQQDTLDLRPDILSILIGINLPDDTVYEQKMRFLLDKTLKELPDVKIILMEPIYLPVDKTEQQYNIDRMVKNMQKIIRNLAEEYNTMLVCTNDVLNKALESYPAERYWLWDGIHPTPALHYLISEEWQKVLLQSGYLEALFLQKPTESREK